MRNRPSAASRPSTRSPAGLLANALATRPRREVGRPDALVVVRVDGQHPATGVGREQDPGQPAAGRQAERMGRRGTEAPARAGVAVDVLDEGPAREDVDRLHPAADAEDRHAPGVRDGPGLVFEGVALRLGRHRAGVGATVAGRVDVGAAAQQQPVHRGERRGAFGRVDRRGDEDRVAAGVADRGGIQRVLASREVRIARRAGSATVTTIRGLEATGRSTRAG